MPTTPRGFRYPGLGEPPDGPAQIQALAEDVDTDLSANFQPIVAAAGQAIATDQQTTSTSFTDLATIGPQVAGVVGASGRILVFAKCDMSAATGETALFDFALTGANTAAGDLDRAIRYQSTIQESKTLVASVSGLNPGLTTVTLKHRSLLGGAASYRRRRLGVYFL